MSERRNGIIIRTPSTPPISASERIVQYEKYGSPTLRPVAGSIERKRNPGSVKTTPAAMDSPADPIVWTMLFSRIVDDPSRLNTEIASTAIGIDAETVRPALSAR